jgi:hypothetical protein
MRAITFCCLFLLLATASCIKQEQPPEHIMGMKPVYVSEKDFYDIKSMPEQPLKYTGTIYIWQQYFLVIEYRKGIHVYDRSDPAAPVYISFLNIPGAADFTISGKTLFADNGFDILSINIADLRAIKVNTILRNATKNSRDMPPGYKGYFECHDPGKGYYIGWDSAWLDRPRCRIGID